MLEGVDSHFLGWGLILPGRWVFYYYFFLVNSIKLTLSVN